MCCIECFLVNGKWTPSCYPTNMQKSISVSDTEKGSNDKSKIVIKGSSYIILSALDHETE
jgi:hypothetical protein